MQGPRDTRSTLPAPRGPGTEVNPSGSSIVLHKVGWAIQMNDRSTSEPTPAAETARLVRASRAGDPEAFGRLIEIHQRTVTRLAYRFLGDRDEADAAAQDAFVNAWECLGDFRDECPFGAWLSRITVNQCRDRLKRKRLVVTESSLMTGTDGRPANVLETMIDSAPGPEARAASREIGRKIVELTHSLPPMQREVFALRYYDDRSLAEIAALFRVTVGTVKAHLFRATQRIRISLEALYG